VGAFPTFVTSIFLIIIFACVLNVLPTSGMFGFQTSSQYADAAWWRPYLTVDFGQHYILPFAAVLLRYAYLPVLIMRTSVVEVIGQGFFFYHRMTGLPGGQRLQHLLKHASLPLITLYPVSMTRAIGGLVLIEIVFNWPGIGFTLVQAVPSRDFPVVQFVFFLVAAFVIVANFGVESSTASSTPGCPSATTDPRTVPSSPDFLALRSWAPFRRAGIRPDHRPGSGRFVGREMPSDRGRGCGKRNRYAPVPGTGGSWVTRTRSG
jgi:hypothetical protein